MELTTKYCDNYFPPIIIECYLYSDGEYVLETTYNEPSDGIYDKSVFGLWRVKYKKINPNYYCQGQLNL